MTPSLQLRAASGTTLGRIRATNEDRFLADGPRGLYAVADGIGGLPFGERASERAIRTLSACVGTPSDRRSLDAAFSECNRAVTELGRLLSPDRGIGTTLSAVHISAERCVSAHLGDSQIHLIRPRNGPSIQLTIDHTSPSAQVRLGDTLFQPPPLLERYIGFHGNTDPDVREFLLRPGDRLVLCTDGATRALEPGELELLSRAQSLPEGLVKALLHVADLRGGLDNATVVVVDALGQEGASAPMDPAPK